MVTFRKRHAWPRNMCKIFQRRDRKYLNTEVSENLLPKFFCSKLHIVEYVQRIFTAQVDQKIFHEMVYN